MDSSGPEYAGFWAILRDNWTDVSRGWDLWLSLGLATVLTVLVPVADVGQRLKDVASVEVSLASALIGLVLAALAILTVFLDRGYLKVLVQAEGGLAADLFQFSFLAALLVIAIVLAVVAIVLAPCAPAPTYALLWGGLFFLFWSVFAAMSLVGFIGSHTTNRAKYLLKLAASEEDQSHVE
jgi:hypothetical protein